MNRKKGIANMTACDKAGFPFLMAALLFVCLSEPVWAGGPLSYLPGSKVQIECGEGESAVLLLPEHAVKGQPIPWVWQVAGKSKDVHKIYMHLLTNGVAVVAYDKPRDGDASYGTPGDRDVLTQIYTNVVEKHGLAPRMCILTRGPYALLAYNWAVEHPDKISGIAALAPLTDLASAPDQAAVAKAYGWAGGDAVGEMKRNNPLERLAPLAEAKVELYHVHGNKDARVPIEPNTHELAKRYQALGGTIRVKTIEGADVKTITVPGDKTKGGHYTWSRLDDPELVQFIEKHVGLKPPAGGNGAE
jgi:hypothetical protein